MRAGVWVNDDDGHLFLIADLVHTPQSWTGETVGHRVHYYNNVLLSIHCICYCDCGQVDSHVMLAARGGKSSLVTKQNTNWFPGHWTMGPLTSWLGCPVSESESDIVHWLIWANTGHSGSHLSLIQTERENIGARVS